MTYKIKKNQGKSFFQLWFMVEISSEWNTILSYMQTRQHLWTVWVAVISYDTVVVFIDYFLL